MDGLATMDGCSRSMTGKPAVKAILFDLDGTLLDTEKLSDHAMLAALDRVLPASVKAERARHDNLLPWELKKKILGKRGAEWAPIILDHARQVWKVDESADPDVMTVQGLWTRWEDCLNDLCPQVEVCQGAPELVQALSGLPLAIATSSRAAAVQKKRQRHEASIFRHIALIVAGDHPAVQNGKPAPDIYLEAARQVGVRPEECLVFEDALTGVQAGKDAGCQVVAVPDPRFSDEEKKAFHEYADVVLNDLTEFRGDTFGIPMN